MTLARAVGEINDYSFQGPYHDDMLGLEHWLYCLGLRDARTISGLQLWNSGCSRAGSALGLPAPSRPRRRAAARGPALHLLVHLPLPPQLRRRHPGPAAPLLRGIGQEIGAGQGGLYKAMATGLLLVLNFPRGGCFSGSRLDAEPRTRGPAGPDRRLARLHLDLAGGFLLALVSRPPARQPDATGRLAAAQASDSPLKRPATRACESPACVAQRFRGRSGARSRQASGRELGDDPGEAGQAPDHGHAHPVFADQGLGVGEEVVGHVDPAGGEPVLGEEPLGVGDLSRAAPCRSGRCSPSRRDRGGSSPSSRCRPCGRSRRRGSRRRRLPPGRRRWRRRWHCAGRCREPGPRALPGTGNLRVFR